MTTSVDRRPLPQNLEAEQSVLGAILLDSEVAGWVLNELPADDFYADRHRIIYRAMQALAAEGRPIDLVTVGERLRGEDTEKWGGLSYLAHLQGFVPTAANVGAYAEIVMEQARRRRSIQRIRRVLDGLYDPAEDLTDLALLAAWAVEDSPGQHADVESIGEVAARRVTELRSRPPGQIPGRTTGFQVLDRLTGGLEPGALYLLAARPGMGKTGLGLAIVLRSAAATGLPWLVVSREMTAESLSDRAVASLAQIPLGLLRRNSLAEMGWTKVADVLERLHGLPVYVTTRARRVSEIRDRARALQKSANGRLGGIMVDYLQLLQARTKGGNRQEQVAEISRDLKNLAVDLDTPVLALAQVSRAVEGRENKRPTLADLRESGQLEADAEAVLFLYRPAYYDRLEGKETPPADKVEVILAKHRNDEVRTGELLFHPEWVLFDDPVGGNGT
ncbi:replicative DNA helicase [Caldinitratiruptor microaerophilus]|uniref:DNA 5'-3' helicase n=1 Tax=Caldinitratiruptor microaerophilus TaxID=671077 RepID=A0AA35CM79_9FIRM|nr:replicative DNA helicase [Caldinitratiruptor microaerophilus]BDG61904.1 replicative DNA helicase [Caldinitratiruptor microaerophilus]